MRACLYRTAVSGAVLMTLALLLAGSAFAVTVTGFTPNNGLTNLPGKCTGAVITVSGDTTPLGEPSTGVGSALRDLFLVVRFQEPRRSRNDGFSQILEA